MTEPIRLSHFSDVLCVWAYVSQIRLDELKSNFGERIEITQHFINLFGDTDNRIGRGWSERGGYQAFGRHVIEVCDSFPHAVINPEIWNVCRPRSSGVAHLFFKALQRLECEGLVSAEPVTGHQGRTLVEEFIRRVRLAFFRDARDIGQTAALFAAAEELRLPISAIEQRLNDGTAMAALCSDLEKKDQHNIEGSPTYLLNDGRQKLYGNVGYLIIEANVLELMAAPQGRASWC